MRCAFLLAAVLGVLVLQAAASDDSLNGDRSVGSVNSELFTIAPTSQPGEFALTLHGITCTVRRKRKGARKEERERERERDCAGV